MEGGCGGSGSHLGARIAVEGGGGSPGSRLGATEVVVGGGGSLAREGGGGRGPSSRLGARMVVEGVVGVRTKLPSQVTAVTLPKIQLKLHKNCQK